MEETSFTAKFKLIEPTELLTCFSMWGDNFTLQRKHNNCCNRPQANWTCKLLSFTVAKYSNAVRCWELVLRPLHFHLGNASFSERTRTCPKFLIRHLNGVAGTATALGNSSISQASLWTHMWKIHAYWICVHRMVRLSFACALSEMETTGSCYCGREPGLSAFTANSALG